MTSGQFVRPRILIVDGSVLARRQATELLSATGSWQILRAAANLRFALARITEERPDAVVLGDALPDGDGAAAIAAVRAVAPDLPIVAWGGTRPEVVSSQPDTRLIWCRSVLPGGERAVAGPPESVVESLHRLLDTTAAPARVERRLPPPAGTQPVGRRQGVGVVLIGVSTGGPNALVELLPMLPGDLSVPILIVQHMPPMFTRLLAERLDARCRLRVREAVAGDRPQPGQVFVAPGDHHMTVDRDLQGMVLSLDQGAPENSCRPAVDVLFRSAAASYGAGCLAVVLTGMGQDGLRGGEAIVAAGGTMLAQDEASSVVWGMPGFVARAGLASEVLPLSQIAAAIERRVATPTPSRRGSRGTEIRT
jgi:two-component system chemotaxis response regulator CheB